jgi:hypothetical protein
MSDEKWREWVEWRLNAAPRPTGTVTQRRLGAAEVLFDMLLKVTPPTMVDVSAAQGQPSAIAHMWLMNAWATDMQRQMNGEPRRLECANVDDPEAAYLTEHAIGLLGMYANYADPGTVDGISSTVSRQILLQPRLQGLSKEDINNKLAIKDAFLKEGIEAHALSLDILSILVDVEAKTGAAKRAISSNSAPAPATKKKWWQA